MNVSHRTIHRRNNKNFDEKRSCFLFNIKHKCVFCLYSRLSMLTWWGRPATISCTTNVQWWRRSGRRKTSPTITGWGRACTGSECNTESPGSLLRCHFSRREELTFWGYTRDTSAGFFWTIEKYRVGKERKDEGLLKIHNFTFLIFWISEPAKV